MTTNFAFELEEASIQKFNAAVDVIGAKARVTNVSFAATETGVKGVVKGTVPSLNVFLAETAVNIQLRGPNKAQVTAAVAETAQKRKPTARKSVARTPVSSKARKTIKAAPVKAAPVTAKTLRMKPTAFDIAMNVTTSAMAHGEYFAHFILSELINGPLSGQELRERFSAKYGALTDAQVNQFSFVLVVFQNQYFSRRNGSDGMGLIVKTFVAKGTPAVYQINTASPLWDHSAS